MRHWFGRVLRAWRVVLFALICVSGITLGLVWHFAAGSDIPALTSHEPLTIDVWESDPTVPVDVYAETYPGTKGADPGQPVTFVELFLSVEKPTSVVVMANQQTDDSGRHPTETFTRVSDDLSSPTNRGGRQWGHIYQLPLPTLPGAVAAPLATFDTDSTLLQISSQAVNARLPAIETLESGNFTTPRAGLVDTTSAGLAGDLEPVTLRPTATFTEALAPENYPLQDWSDAKGRGVRAVFWEPQTIRSSVSISGVASSLTDKSIRVNVPSDGTVQGADFIWQGGYSLSPVLDAVSLDADAQNANYDFLSGIAFATAAAALIALLQERRAREKSHAARRSRCGRPSPPHE